MKSLVLKTVLLLGILISGYFFILLPRQTRQKEILASNYFNLLQNRLAYMELIKLDPNNPNYKTAQIDLLNKIKETNQKGLESADSQIRETMQTQKEILNKLIQAETYEEGITLLKGPESVSLLMQETNLLAQLERSLKH